MKDFWKISIAVLLIVIGVVGLALKQEPAHAQINAISFDSELNKIDGKATMGLLGTSNSLAYRVHEIEKHFHSNQRWVGKAASQTALGDWADDVLTPYVAISGADEYGTDQTGDASAVDFASVLGLLDTPLISGMVKFHFHKILVTDVDHATVYKLRIVASSSTIAAGVAAGQYTELMVKFDAANPTVSAGVPIDVMMPRYNAGVDKIFIEAWNATDNSEIDFLVGIHEYAG